MEVSHANPRDRLRHVGFDGLFDNYEVSNVQWSAPDATSNLTIRGSGTYRVGGEFAIQEQMTLDLSVGSNAPQRFDSGLIAGGGEFAKVDIDISVHGMAACVDRTLPAAVPIFARTRIPGSMFRLSRP